MTQFEQWENVNFCQKLGETASETFQMIKQEHNGEALSCNAAFKWDRCFAQGRDSLEDDELTSQPRMVNSELRIQKVAMHANHFKTLHEVAAAAGSSHGTCHKILSDDMNMSRYLAQCSMRPDANQCDSHMRTFCNLIDSVDKDGTSLNWIITGDETWCVIYCLQLKLQWASWKLPHRQKRRNCNKTCQKQGNA
jgi:hypothetical protein